MMGFQKFLLAVIVFVVFNLSFLDFSAASQSVSVNASSSDAKFWIVNGKRSSEYLQMFVEETDWYNSLVLGPLVPRHIWSPLPKFLQTWLRNYIAGIIVYFVSGGLWCFYIYYWKRNAYLPAEDIPSKEPIFLQIAVSMKAMPLYSALPTVSEYMIEHGWTKCYARVSEVGWPAYIALTMLYLVVVEFGIYWMHRELHDIKPLYKYLHATHHIYNKQNTLSPFAGLAFHPIDGILQAVPHVIVLFIIPVHFFTHEFLLFCRKGVLGTPNSKLNKLDDNSDELIDHPSTRDDSEHEHGRDAEEIMAMMPTGDGPSGASTSNGGATHFFSSPGNGSSGDRGSKKGMTSR